MEKRVNELGLAEPIVQRQGERRIIVELPGIKDPDKAIQVIGKTAMLEFKNEEGETVLNGTDLKDAREQTDQLKGRQARADVAFRLHLVSGNAGQTQRMYLTEHLHPSAFSIVSLSYSISREKPTSFSLSRQRGAGISKVFRRFQKGYSKFDLH